VLVVEVHPVAASEPDEGATLAAGGGVFERAELIAWFAEFG
jgi:hypothetical protein